MRVAAVGLDVPRTVAEDALVDLRASFRGMPCMRTPLTIRVLVIWAVLPSVGEVGDPCVEYGRGNIGGERGIMENAWLKSSVCISMGQRVERVILIPPCIPVELFEFCQVFGEVGHFLMGAMEALNLPL